MTLLIDGAELWFAATNCYIVAPDRGGPAVVIDAPPDVDAIVALLAKHDLTPVALLVTHGHIDHVGGAGGAVARTGVAAYLHPDDDFLAADPGAQLGAVFGVAMPGIAAYVRSAGTLRRPGGRRSAEPGRTRLRCAPHARTHSGALLLPPAR